jgi:hypothetical protein
VPRTSTKSCRDPLARMSGSEIAFCCGGISAVEGQRKSTSPGHSAMRKCFPHGGVFWKTLFPDQESFYRGLRIIVTRLRTGLRQLRSAALLVPTREEAVGDGDTSPPGQLRKLRCGCGSQEAWENSSCVVAPSPLTPLPLWGEGNPKSIESCKSPKVPSQCPVILNRRQLSFPRFHV